MEERVVKKLLELGYDPEKKVNGTSADVYNICKGHLQGLMLFNGRIIADSGFTVVLEDEHLYITNQKVDKENYLFISPLEKRIDVEYISMGGIQLNDHIHVNEKVISTIDSFSLIVEDVRRRPVATFEFWKKGEMLYVPKRG